MESIYNLRVKTNHSLSSEDYNKELLLAETRMNEHSKLRFYIEEDEVDQAPQQQSTGDEMGIFVAGFVFGVFVALIIWYITI